MAQNLRYLRNVARQYIGNLKVPVEDASLSAEKFGHRYYSAVLRRVNSYKPETLGKLAVLGYGNGSRFHEGHVHDPHRRTPINEVAPYQIAFMWRGEHILRYVVAMVILAAMYDEVTGIAKDFGGVGRTHDEWVAIERSHPPFWNAEAPAEV